MEEFEEELPTELNLSFDSSLPVSPERLRAAMALSGCSTYVDFAELCGVSESTVRNWAKGRTIISPAMLTQVQRQTGIPKQFLTNAEPMPRVSAVNFRSSTRSLERERQTAVAWSSVLAEFRRMVIGTRQTPLDTDSLTHAGPIAAAVHARRAVGVADDQPVSNTVRVVESLGILTVYGPANTSEIDAFSGWADGHPFVVLNPFKGSYLRQRFDVAHELGHIIMHGSSHSPVATKEEEANAFARAFLYPPTNANFRRLSNALKLDDSLDGLVNIQEEWKVSARALVEIGARSINKVGRSASDKRKLLSEQSETVGQSASWAPEEVSLLPNAAEEVESETGRPIVSLATELGISSRDVRIMTSRDASSARSLST